MSDNANNLTQKRVLTFEEAGRMLSLDGDTVRKMALSGKLTGVSALGTRNYGVTLQSIEDFLRSAEDKNRSRQSEEASAESGVTHG